MIEDERATVALFERACAQLGAADRITWADAVAIAFVALQVKAH